MHMREKSIIPLISDLLINSIPLLKDEEYQRRVWFQKKGPEQDSYSQAILHFIGSCESILKNPSSIHILGEENYSLLKKLYDLIVDHYDLIESRIDPDLLQEDELLNDPNWHDIQQLAEEIEPRLIQLIQRKLHE